jgi:hypothetical protein
VYVFGRYQYQKSISSEGEVHTRMRAVAMADWRVHLREHHEGYISVEEFEQNCQRLEYNRTNGEATMLSGAVREGLTLLQGLLLCGRRLTVRYQGNGGIYPIYECSWQHREGLATKACMRVRSDLLDAAISEEVFKLLKPAELELALAALRELEERGEALMRQWRMRIERAEYEVALAERRYEEADPSNRLVTGTLERRWNEALTRLDEIKTEAAEFQNRQTHVTTAEQKAKALALAHDLPRLWRAPTTQAKDRKRMLRLLIRDITVEKLPAQHQAVLHVRWQGGASNDITVNLPLPMAERVRYPATVIEQVRQLSPRLSDRQIAVHLNQQGIRSPFGNAFTLSMVKWIRYRYDIPTISHKRPEELTVAEVAQRFGVSIGVVHYWIKRNVVAVRRLHDRGAWWITLDTAKEQELRDWVRNSGHLQRQHSNT